MTDHKHDLDTTRAPHEIVLFSDEAVGVWRCPCGYRFPRPITSDDRTAL